VIYHYNIDDEYAQSTNQIHSQLLSL